MKTIYTIPQGTKLPKIRKHLNADDILALLRIEFGKIKDIRPGNTKISLPDALMSSFAMFFLKDPSMLAFDERRLECDPNLKSVFGIETVPSDSQSRTILDQVNPALLRPSFKRLFAQMQRGKALEQLRFLGRYYLISGDGTGYYYSMKVGNDPCLKKKSSSSEGPAFYQQFYGAALVHPDFREVIPFCPEPIVKQDGKTKNDSERMASKRFMQGLRADHPHLPAVILEDALHSNAPHIRDLRAQRLHYIIGAKENDHAFLFMKAFEEEQAGRSTNITIDDPVNPKKRHNFFFVNGVPLNKSNQDVRVNFLEYWEISIDDQGQEIREEQKHFGWVTDLKITVNNVYDIMRAGRSRWKIENETFNTLKTQGYHLGHNYGLGERYLSPLFMTMTMLTFMADQVQQLCCGLFRGAWEKVGSKRALWDKMRGLFGVVKLDTMETLYKLLCFGYERPEGSAMLNST